MKTIILALAGLSLGLVANAQVSEDPAERKAICEAQVTKASTEAGTPEKDPGAVCDCLSAGMAENEALRDELVAAKGLPNPDDASEDMIALIHSCQGATSEG